MILRPQTFEQWPSVYSVFSFRY